MRFQNGFWLFGLSLALLAGCSSKPMEIRYFTLHTSESVAQINTKAKQSAAHSIKLSKVNLADYLQQINLVMQTDDHKLYFSRQNLWAESLQAGIEKALIDSLNQSSDLLVMGTDAPQSADYQYELIVNVDHLLPTSGSQAIADGHYWIIDHKGEQQAQRFSFNFSQPLSQDGYHHAVLQMRKLIQQLASQIAEHIQDSQ